MCSGIKLNEEGDLKHKCLSLSSLHIMEDQFDSKILGNEH
jgi:hypothetical protein